MEIVSENESKISHFPHCVLLLITCWRLVSAIMNVAVIHGRRGHRSPFTLVAFRGFFVRLPIDVADWSRTFKFHVTVRLEMVFFRSKSQPDSWSVKYIAVSGVLDWIMDCFFFGLKIRWKWWYHSVKIWFFGWNFVILTHSLYKFGCNFAPTLSWNLLKSKFEIETSEIIIFPHCVLVMPHE